MTNAKQFMLTPAAGKRLIGKGIASHPLVTEALEKRRTIIIIAGTTNGYVAQEILKRIDQCDGFEITRFFRGVTLPPAMPTTEFGRLPDETSFPGDVVIADGKWQPGKTVFDVLQTLKKRDLILKGANAISLPSFKPGIYIGHPEAGTIGAILPLVVGKRLSLLVPVGLEKRISGDLDVIARQINLPGTHGPRMLPLHEQGYTEIQALEQQSGATVQLVAAGGVAGAEGSCWLLVRGTEEQLERAVDVIESVKDEPLFRF